jgi:hypothetical protein
MISAPLHEFCPPIMRYRGAVQPNALTCRGAPLGPKRRASGPRQRAATVDPASGALARRGRHCESLATRPPYRIPPRIDGGSSIDPVHSEQQQRRRPRRRSQAPRAAGPGTVFERGVSRSAFRRGQQSRLPRADGQLAADRGRKALARRTVALAERDEADPEPSPNRLLGLGAREEDLCAGNSRE